MFAAAGGKKQHADVQQVYDTMCEQLPLKTEQRGCELCRSLLTAKRELTSRAARSIETANLKKNP